MMQKRESKRKGEDQRLIEEGEGERLGKAERQKEIRKDKPKSRLIERT